MDGVSCDVISSCSLFIPIIVGVLSLIRQNKAQRNEIKEYTGSCHCKTVTFKLQASKHLVVWDCNCSICHMKKNWHFIVPSSSFSVLTGENDLTEYRFNTKVAKHMFCKHCGVQAYYVPLSNPDGIAVTLACIPTEQIISSEVIKYDGQNWEAFYTTSDIAKHSKT